MNLNNTRIQMEDETVPSNAPANELYLFFSSVTGELSVIKDAGGAISLEGGGGAQTPWTSAIDADGNNLVDFGRLEFRNPAVFGGNTVAWYGYDGVNMKWNIPTGDDDGNSATPVEYITEAQQQQVFDLLINKNVEEGKLCALLKIESVAKMPTDLFQKAVAMLEAKKRNEAKSENS